VALLRAPWRSSSDTLGRGHDGPHTLFPEHLPWGSIDTVPTARLLHEQDLKTAQFPESSLNVARAFQASDDQAACDMANECGRGHCGPPACTMAIQFGCVFITAGPSTKLCAWGEGVSGVGTQALTRCSPRSSKSSQGPNQGGHSYSYAVSAAGHFQDEAAYDFLILLVLGPLNSLLWYVPS
jgi:hypothetical protein